MSKDPNQKYLNYRQRRMAVPWRHILGCRGLWAIVVAHVGHTWGQLVLYAEVPAYMHHVLKVDIRAVRTQLSAAASSVTGTCH